MDGRSLVAAQIAQRNRIIKLRFVANAYDDLLLPQRVAWADALCEPYRIELTALSLDQAIDSTTMLGQAVLITIALENGDTRPLTGIVDQFAHLGSDGGLAHYRLILRPAYALLDRHHGNRIFQDRTIPEIVETIISEQQARNGAFARFSLIARLSKTYERRSYVTMWGQSARQFIDMLLAKEGISYRFEHTERDGKPHTDMLLFDDAYQLPPIAGQYVRYRQSDDDVDSEALLAWQAHGELIPGTTQLVSHEYKANRANHGSAWSVIDQGDAGNAAAAGLENYRALAPYHGTHARDMERYARLQQDATDQKARSYVGVGTARAIAAGQWFQLEHHPGHASHTDAQRQFIVTAHWSITSNQLPTELTQCLPPAWLAAHPDTADAWPGTGPEQIHAVRFTAVPRSVPLVPRDAGVPPLAPAWPMTATVVGPRGDEVHTDAGGRIKVQFDFQRPEDHPHGGADNDDRSSTWLRHCVAQAGDGYGHQFIPRIGQEVLVSFLHGDIDRPVVIGVLHNGTHQPPAFDNVGSLPGNRALSGIKTREHHGRGYNHLKLDDTTGELSASIATTQAETVLSLGHLSTPRIDGKATPRGQGAELRTLAATAIRALRGILFSTRAADADGHQLDRRRLDGLLEECTALTAALGEGAAQHGGQASDLAGQTTLREQLDGWPKGQEAGEAGAGVIALDAAEGMVNATAKNHLTYAGENLDTVAQQHLQLTSGQRLSANASEIQLFAQAAGLLAIAHQGALRLEAQNGELVAQALKDMLFTANGEIFLKASAINLMTNSGTVVRLSDEITLTTAGQIKLHAVDYRFAQPSSQPSDPAGFGKAPTDARFRLRYADAGLATAVQAIAEQAYEIKLDDGSLVQGKADSDGLTCAALSEAMRIARIVATRTPKAGTP